MTTTSFTDFQKARLSRIRRMNSTQLSNKLKEKTINLLSFRRNLRRLAFSLNKLSIGLFVDNYQERQEVGPVNFEVKLRRQAAGGPFEPPIVVMTNRVAAQIAGDAKRILELGSGTGILASELAQNSTREIIASEFDEGARNWAIENRSAPNIHYDKLALKEIKSKSFDLAIAIEVIEHLDDFSQFLKELTAVSNRAIISTPNKNRSAFDSIANTPTYSEHVREWSAGEFYWVLKCFYQEVELYTIPNIDQALKRYHEDNAFIPQFSRCSVLSNSSVLVAHCHQPRQFI